MENVIEVRNLKKNYQDVEAIKGITFNVKKGSLFSFLGINGAGKSTTIDILCTLTEKTSGTVKIAGHTIGPHENDAIRKEIGVVFQDSLLDERLSVYENICHRGIAYGLKKEELKENYKFVESHLHLADIAKKKYGKLSGGQRRRADVARALIHRPSILFLDEPTTGLDPQTRMMIWNTIETLREKEKLTVLLTTHYMEEAASASYVVIIDHGRIAAEGTPYELKNDYVRDYLTIYGVTREEVESLGMAYEEVRDGYRIAIETPLAATDLILKHASVFRDYELVKGGMDDVFLSVTGKKLGGEQ